MTESIYTKVNDYGSVTVSLASPEDIRSWSFGEVKKPETINYRTYRPERDGLFCERIFGPERDWECTCGKYKGIKHKGIVCDKCGVMVTHSRVRRKRMGHINLAAPVAHIWFFKAMPSRLGNLLGMKVADLERVIYFQDFVVTDPGDTELEFRQVIDEDQYHEFQRQWGPSAFKALMGQLCDLEAETLIHLEPPLGNEHRRADDQHSVGLATRVELGPDQARLDGLAETNGVGDEDAGPDVQRIQRLGHRGTLVGEGIGEHVRRDGQRSSLFCLKGSHPCINLSQIVLCLGKMRITAQGAPKMILSF